MKPLLAIALMLAGLFVVAGCDNDDPTATSQDPIVNFTTYSSDYLDTRFFKLDLPLIEPSGRDTDDHIIIDSIKIFKMIQASQPAPEDLLNVATYVDSLGFLQWDGLDFEHPYAFGRYWRENINWTPMLNVDGELVAVDLGSLMVHTDILAVVYEVRRDDGTIVKVGDIPGVDVPQQQVVGGQGLFYRMKLLKAEASAKEPHTFGYALRNIYSLGSKNIDPVGFNLRIERRSIAPVPLWQDENGVDYLRIFGLDRDNPQRTGFPDGLFDVWDPFLIDLDKGLLTFPEDFPRPFAPGGNPVGRPQEADMMAQAVYSANADTAAFVWDPSFLREYQSWQIYDLDIYPWHYSRYGAFKIIATYARSEGDDP